jgi:hypothetical protein
MSARAPAHPGRLRNRGSALDIKGIPHAVLKSHGFLVVNGAGAEYLHLTGTRFTTLSFRTKSLPAWLRWFCVAVLLLATTAQAVHVCSAQLVPTQNNSQQVTSSGTAPRVCLLCLMAGSIGVAIVITATAVGSTNRLLIRSPQTKPISYSSSFALYVRPPPLN